MSVKNKVQIQEYLYDFSVDGGAQGAIVLSDKANKNPIPVGAVIQRCFARVITQPVGVSGTLKWGNGNGDYHAAVAVASLTEGAVFNSQDDSSDNLLSDADPGHPISLLVTDATSGNFTATIATTDFTAGKVVFAVEYWLPAIDL